MDAALGLHDITMTHVVMTDRLAATPSCVTSGAASGD